MCWHLDLDLNASSQAFQKKDRQEFHFPSKSNQENKLPAGCSAMTAEMLSNEVASRLTDTS